MNLRKNKLIIIFIPLLFLSSIFLYSEDSLEVINKQLERASKLIDEKSYEKALEIYKNLKQWLLKFTLQKTSRIYNNMGFCAYKMNDDDLAEFYYSKAISLDPNYVICLNNLASLHINNDCFSEALIFLSRAFEKDNKNIKVLFNSFVCYLKLRNKEMVKIFIKKAFQSDNKYTTQRLRKNGLNNAQIKRLKKEIGLV